MGRRGIMALLQEVVAAVVFARLDMDKLTTQTNVQ